MRAGLLNELNALRDRRIPVAVVTDIASGDQRLVKMDTLQIEPLSDEIADRFRSGKSGMTGEGPNEIFVQVHVPSPRLVIVGAVHISQALAPMAASCSFDVTIIDPRTAFATEERFAGIDLHAEWPEEVLKHRPLDAYTALAALTHDPKIDDFPLRAALETGCFYVGALGSRKTHAKRVERLLEAGVAKSNIETMHAPIGLNIGAASPAEIAVATLAQIIGQLRVAPAADREMAA